MTALRFARDFVVGGEEMNEYPVVRLVRVAVFCGIAAALEKLLAANVVALPQAWAWATPLLTGALVAGDKYARRQA